MKLAFVVQRYGATIAGGSEAHCRLMAERLATAHAITILTTCTADYVTWNNELPAGEAVEGGVRVIRFPVAHPRRLSTFADISDEVFAGGAPAARQHEWFRENGPDTPGILEHLRAQGHEYDLVLFWTFRYAPSYFGLPLVADRAVLVPTAEEDPAIHLDVLQEYFRLPAGYLFLTPEEEALVSQRAGTGLTPSATIGMGLSPASLAGSQAMLDAEGIPRNYVLYMGRVDRNKGCDTLLDYFESYLDGGGDATLVLAGPIKLRVPSHPRIRALGYVTDDMRDALIAHARVLIVPSPYESLSIVLLEGWNRAVPALVNARCKVLKGQVRRANGGLHYRSPREFAEALTYLLANEEVRATLGRQGLAYVDQEYRWPTVMARTEALLAAAAAAARQRRAG
ncbi:MAG: glycosyltransferase family 4 protein [Vicinamibacterales bacterium]